MKHFYIFNSIFIAFLLSITFLWQLPENNKVKKSNYHLTRQTNQEQPSENSDNQQVLRLQKTSQISQLSGKAIIPAFKTKSAPGNEAPSDKENAEEDHPAGNTREEVKNKNSKYFTESAAVELNLGRFSILGPPGALKGPTNLSVEGIKKAEVASMNPGMTNVTGQYSGYRLGPDNSTFDKLLSIGIPYDTASLPPGSNPKQIRSFYYDEIKKQWIQLPVDTIDEQNGIVYTYTDHFTDFVNGVIKTPEAPQTEAHVPTKFKELQSANPLSDNNQIAPPQANNKGTANLNFPIEIPQGRKGLQPNLNVTYNSGGGNSWMGIGWNLTLPSIEVETRWGVPRYSNSLETESYLLDGKQLTPLARRGKFQERDTNKAFHHRVRGSFDTIIRHGENPTNYWWEVIDRNGTTYYYGKYSDDTTVNSNFVLKDKHDNIGHWALAEVMDLHGNQIKYTYQKKYHVGFQSGTDTGKQIYPESIKYTGHENTDGKYNIQFELDNAGEREDIIINARKGFKQVTANRLDKITVQYKNKFIRQYRILYEQGATASKSRICRVMEVVDSTLLNSPLLDGKRCGDNNNPGKRQDAGIREHGFNYYDENDYGFTQGKKLKTIEPEYVEIGDIKLFNKDKQYSFGQTSNSGHNYGGSLGVGFDVNFVLKTLTISGNFIYSKGNEEIKKLHIDIDGDGLPDRVEYDGGQIKYNKLTKQQGEYNFTGNWKTISGLSTIGKSNSKSYSVGGEIQPGFGSGLKKGGISYMYNKSNTFTSHYFSDVNGDGYVDFINGEDVLINKIDNQGEPNFINAPQDTIYNPQDPCNYIIQDVPINDTLNELPKESSDNQIESYDRDAVRLWVAPYNGAVYINAPIQLIEDTSFARLQSSDADGITYMVQYENDILEQDKIAGDDYGKKEFEDALAVSKGDHIYFRVNNNENRDFDNVQWNPAIHYKAVESNTGPNNKEINQFNLPEDFMVYRDELATVPEQGAINVTANVNSPAQSDSITLLFIHNQDTLKKNTYQDNQNFNYSLDTVVDVEVSDSLNLFLWTNTTIDYQAIDYDITYQYVSSDSADVDTSSEYKQIIRKPGIRFNLLQNIKQKIRKVELQAGDYVFHPEINFDPDSISNANGQIVFSIKKENDLLDKKVINIVNGKISGNPEISKDFQSSQEIYCELFIANPDLADDILGASAIINGDTKDIGITAAMPDTLFKFGHLYRGWGQFTYKGPVDQPIQQNKLYMGQTYKGSSNPVAQIDTNNISGTNDLKTRFEDIGFQNPKDTYFNRVYADLDSLVYRDYAQYTSFTGNRIDLTQRKNPGSQTEKIYISPIMQPSTDDKIANSFCLISSQEGNSWGLGALVANGTYTSSDGKTLTSYRDMNGDRYPDPVNHVNDKKNVQYTNPWGGFSPNLTKISNNKLSESVHSTAKSASVSVNLPRVKQNGLSGLVKPSLEGVNTGGFYGNLNANTDYKLIDLNGDGLPDNVNKKTNQVSLNHGYEFGSFEAFTVNEISSSNSNSLDLNSSYLGEIFGFSYSLGLGISGTSNKKDEQLMDINGDGLPDRVVYENNEMKVYFNNGTEFKSPVSFGSGDDINKSITVNGHIFGSFTVGFPIFPVVKGAINGQAGANQSYVLEKSKLIDINNDGYPDLVYNDGLNGLYVKYNKLGKLNKLKTVYTPANATYTIDYEMADCSQDMPNRRWVMNYAKIFDGHTGDGEDNIQYAFSYENGYYNRSERAFMGFEKVETRQLNKASDPYRKTIEKYHNRDYLFSGLKYYQATLDGDDNLYTEKKYTYKKKEIATGDTIPQDSIQCYGPYYPAISKEETFYYEGQTTPQIKTRKNYVHGAYGNIVEVDDLQNTSINEDNVKTEISYQNNTVLNILGLPDTVRIKDNAGNVLRMKTAQYNHQTGDITKIFTHNGNNIATTEMDYDTYGNIIMIKYPENYKGQKMQYNYSYDSKVHNYVTNVEDAFGYASSTDYNYRIGKPVSKIDIRGQKVNYTYYSDGRLKTIQGPNEIANNQPWLIKYEYFNQDTNSLTDTIPWARTTHYDPLNPGNQIQTVVFADGLGRILQTKKKANVNGETQMIVSGRKEFDAYGRPVKSWYPITEPLGQDSVFNFNYDTVNPTKSQYDILDRKKLVIIPDDNEYNFNYGFGVDQFGKTCFKSTTTDANGTSYHSYNNVMGKQTTIEAPEQAITTFKYSPLGELEESTDPENNTTDYQYDMAGQLRHRNHPDAGGTTYEYDKAGNLLTILTANLEASGGLIEYKYDYNRITQINYPENPENNVYYEHGSPGNGTASGRIVKMQDASGVQEFEYGRLGELTSSIKTFVMPESGETYTFETQWEYDSWNRIKKIVYPDNEHLYYNYNNGGELDNMVSDKNGISYVFIDSIKYDKFGRQTHLFYGNGTQVKNEFDPVRNRLQKLVTKDNNQTKMYDITYGYDNVGNITNINNQASPVNGLGGSYAYAYEYDKLYRLTNATGNLNTEEYGGFSYNLNMAYTPSGNIEKKQQSGKKLIDNIETDFAYNREYSYNSGKPHAVSYTEDNITGNAIEYEWDNNGNMLSHFSSNDEYITNHCWDEENRLAAILNTQEYSASMLNSYIYNAGGQRIWKFNGPIRDMSIDGIDVIGEAYLNNKVLYASPYMVIDDNQHQYTKHYYIQGRRITSKIGSGFANAPLNPIEERLSQVTESPYGNNYEEFGAVLREMMQRNFECAGFIDEEVIFEPRMETIHEYTDANGEENDRYFYHSDHLGSTSFITDANGEPYQFLQYLPFGESFISQRLDEWKARYTFSAKEKDEATGYHYFGARYYDSDVSVWLSVDPMSDFRPNLSPYNYVQWNPLNRIDPTGMLDDGKPRKTDKDAKENEMQTADGKRIDFDLDGPLIVADRPEGDKKTQKGGDNLPNRTNNNGDGTDRNTIKRSIRYVGSGATYTSGAIGLTQIGMREYRSSLSIHSKIGTFGKFSSKYNTLGKLGGRLGYAGAGISLISNIGELRSGEIGAGRFAYRLGSLGTSIGVGSTIGGPWGALGGAAVGGISLGAEYIYDNYLVPLGNEIQYQIWNFENAIKGGWYPGR